MNLHDFAIIATGLVNVGALLAGILKLHKIASHVEKTFDFFSLEHEILIRDYCQRNNIDVAQLPTRLPKAAWWKR